MDSSERICASDHDEYVLDHAVVLIWGSILVSWEEVPGMDEE